MKLREVSYAMKVAGEVAEAGSRLFESFAGRRLSGWPVVLGLGAGFAIGALVFSPEARKRVSTWLSESARIDHGSPTAEPEVRPAVRPS